MKIRLLAALIGVFFMTQKAYGVFGETSLYAGEGLYWGDGNNIPAATFYQPKDAVRDSAGNIYISDTLNNVIRKISSAGAVSTLAGSGNAAYQDGTQTAAAFNQPLGLCLDEPNDRIFVADYNNNRIRGVVLSTGYVWTVAGGASAGINNGNTYNARFNHPKDVAYDTAGFIYVADTTNNKIRRVDLSLNTVTTSTGAGAGYLEGPPASALFSTPSGLEIDLPNRLLYIADTGNHKIRAYNLDTFVTALVAGSTSGFVEGSGAAAKFSVPKGLALDAAGMKLYVGDSNNDAVRVIDLNSNSTTSLIAGTTNGYLEATGSAARFDAPEGLIFIASENKLIVADTQNNRLRSVALPGNVTSLYAGFGNYGGDTLSVPGVTFNNPQDVCVNTVTGRVYIADGGNNAIRMVDSSGVITTIAGGGAAGYLEGTGTAARFNLPKSIVLDSKRNILYISDTNNNRIRALDLSTMATSLVAGGGAGFYAEGIGAAAAFYNPEQIDMDEENNVIYVADTRNNRIRSVLPATGQTALLSGSGTAGYAEGAQDVAAYNQPKGIFFGKTGNQVVVADTGNNRIRKVDIITHVASIVVGDGTTTVFSAPTRLEFSLPLNSLFVADTGHYRIVQLDFNIFTAIPLSGSGVSGYVEGVSTTAQFGNIGGLNLDEPGNTLYVADVSNNRIRKIDIYKPTATATVTKTNTPTFTPTNTVTYGSTYTTTPTVTETSTVSSTPTLTPFISSTVTQTVTQTLTVTDTATVTQTLTQSPTFTQTEVLSATATYTVTQTQTQTFTASQTQTITPTQTASDTQSVTPTITQTFDSTATVSPTVTLSATATESATTVITPTVTPTGTQTTAMSMTQTMTVTQTQTQAAASPTNTPTLISASHTITPTLTATLTATETTVFVSTPTVTPVEYTEKDKNFVRDDFVYPNPNKGEFRIAFVTTKHVKSLKIKIYTMSYRLIKEMDLENVISGAHDIQIQGLNSTVAPGIYFYMLAGEDENNNKDKAYGEIIILK